jgi:hypothetical protein
MFITVIDLSRTCDSISTLIYNASVIFMIYSWIKIKPKVIINPTVLKMEVSIGKINRTEKKAWRK